MGISGAHIKPYRIDSDEELAVAGSQARFSLLCLWSREV
jgi:hypothetical protein